MKILELKRLLKDLVYWVTDRDLKPRKIKLQRWEEIDLRPRIRLLLPWTTWCFSCSAIVHVLVSQGVLVFKRQENSFSMTEYPVCCQGILCILPSTTNFRTINQFPTCKTSMSQLDNFSRYLPNLSCLVLRALRLMIYTIKKSRGVVAPGLLGKPSNTIVSSLTPGSLIISEWSIAQLIRAPSYHHENQSWQDCDLQRWNSIITLMTAEYSSLTFTE